MKRLFSLSFLMLFIVTLVGCSDTTQNSNKFTLPDLTNQTQGEVDTTLQGAPITIIYKEVRDETKNDGTFIEYGDDLKPNDIIEYGSVIYVYFAKEEMTTSDSTVELPSLDGKSLNEIVTIMNKYNFIIQFNYIESDTVDDHMFISYGEQLVAGSKMHKNATLTINLSKYLPSNEVNLPNLTGKEKMDIELLFHPLDLNVVFTDVEDNRYDTGKFIRYASYHVGDAVEKGTTIEVVIANNGSDYFAPIEIEYDGPRLDSIYLNVDPINPRGGFFEAPLTQCVDGDTAKFDYPDYIDVELNYPGQSVRFLNMDTQETYTGGEEEWGKPGSNYTCDQLQSAESIIIQTDPDDNLTGNHGRLLSWIWIVPEGTELKSGEADHTIDQYELLNYKIMQQGLAEVKYLFGAGQITNDGKTYTEWMYQAENYAKENDLGQWSDLLDPYWDYNKDEPLF
ncbi:thermonuclease family protein [Haloplasma contractile]|uniref:Thermonuclease protein n=1 Tax=Haloplasma contractile SSD-17B TaxID=1033810 RepID=U2FRK4_9MOLU|nr:thermonuclease family protein [Haloplasma contractile]ERJ13594.1 Thermonuclease protein [Haloplasma contractile SSD-17B]